MTALRDPSPLGGAAAALFSCLDGMAATITFAESCTGGMAAAALTSVPGSSRVFWGGIVSYTEAAKTSLLQVSAGTLGRFGAVSRETAEAMAKGALAASGADFAASVTGFAGPDAPESEMGPGRVCFAWAAKDGRLVIDETRFSGSRSEIREAACLHLLEGANSFCRSSGGGGTRY